MPGQLNELDLDDDSTFVLALAGGGALAILIGWILGSRFLRVLGFLAAIAGAGLYARGRLAERDEKIEAAESSIRSELDDLDPIARAQVLQGLSESEL
jgi:hypothetical protein